jgi:protein-tyrosine kinase
MMEQGDIISTAIAGTAINRGERSIGATLIRAGRLTLENAERILRLQREKGLRFGDAGIKLGLLTQADVDFALARQFGHPCLVRGESKVSEELTAAYRPLSPQTDALRTLRSQLMLRWFDSDPAHKALAIVSAQGGEGRSFIAANLAVVFSQLGERTLLIDADMRKSRQHDLFGLENRAGLSAVLSSRGGPEVIQRVPGLLDLSVLPAGVRPPNPLDLLARPLFRRLLGELAKQFDVMLLDSPPAAEYADAQAVAVSAGGALIVARKNASRMWQVRGVSDNVAHGSTTIVGSVLNDF